MLTILNINGNFNYGLVEYQNYPKTWLNFEIKSVNQYSYLVEVYWAVYERPPSFLAKSDRARMET